MIEIPRRTFLKGLGTAVALPLLESMLPVRALAASAKAAPVRLAFGFVPNGVSMPQWTPSQVGENFDLPYLLEPLAGLRKEFSIYTGLEQYNAFALQDGPGDHARSAAAWLTGVHPKKTSGSDIHNGISADQVGAAYRIPDPLSVSGDRRREEWIGRRLRLRLQLRLFFDYCVAERHDTRCQGDERSSGVRAPFWRGGPERDG